jgi:KDO2-lipid IV(A) lauroyltransferase
MGQAARGVLRALRQNEMLAILVDQPDDEDWVEVKFFGEPAHFPGGAATLALRTGARVIPGGLVRVGERKFLGFIDGHIRFQPTGNREADIQALTQCIVSSLENWIRRYPDQYYMFRRLWSN